MHEARKDVNNFRILLYSIFKMKFPTPIVVQWDTKISYMIFKLGGFDEKVKNH